MTTRTWGLAAAALVLAVMVTAAVGTAGAESGPAPAPASVAVDDVDRSDGPSGTVYRVDYEPGLAMRLDALLFGSADLERALLRRVGASEDARFRRLTMDRAVVVEK